MNREPLIIQLEFYDRNPVEVAKDLLGKFLVRKSGNEYLVGMIVETEAYLSQDDSAAHNFKGKTKRNESLYKESGHAYVHSMRQYNLIDIVTEGSEKPSSVLIRAVEPVLGMKTMQKLRNVEDVVSLTNGPGKLCIAFDITRALDGAKVTSPESGLFITQNINSLSFEIQTSARIGISSAKDMPLRFSIVDNVYVSKRGK